jgi:hypothetical protein
MAVKEEKLELTCLKLLAALVDLVEIVTDDHYCCDLDLDEDGWLGEADKHEVMREARQAIANAKAQGGKIC